MAKLLLVEDDAQLRGVIEDWLSADNYALDVACDGQEGAYFLSMNEYDLAIFDWELPKISGVDLCKQFRSSGKSMPILMLTGRRAVQDRISGLDAGADDYLTKPFDLGELSARVRALLRRPAQAPSTVLSARKISLETDKARVLKDGQEIALLPKEMALLEFFLKNPGKVFSAEAIVNRVWPSDSEASAQVVKVYINRLRSKLDTEGSESLFKTVHGLGYKLDV